MVTMKFNNVHSDFLIIGSGLAGLAAAIYASELGTVALVTKSKLNISSTYWAQGGIAAAIGKDDSVEDHYLDTLKAGGELSNKNAVKILVKEGIDRVNDLINWGMEFDKVENKLHLGLEGGHSKRRILHAGGDSTGSKIVEFLTKKIQSNKRISIFQNTQVFQLLKKSERCIGANAYTWENNSHCIFYSNNTILATGGGTGIYLRTTNPYTSTGDGISLAYNFGADISDMEFIQFHPTAFYSENGQTFLLSEALRGEGAYLVNGEGRRFMKYITPQAELAARDIVSKAIFYEIRNSKIKSVFLDLTHLDSNKIKSRFETIFEKAQEYNLDLTKNLIPVSPAAHYMIGGIKTDEYGRTNINGLFACGEVASTGVHGVNRLASNSLLECLVFAKRAIDSCEIDAEKNNENYDISDNNVWKYKINNSLVTDFIKIKNKIATLLNNNAGIVRNNDLLTEALIKIEEIEFPQSDEFEYYSFRVNSILQISKMIINAALLRKESRGTHQRSEFTNIDKEYLGNFIFNKNSEPNFKSIHNSYEN